MSKKILLGLIFASFVAGGAFALPLNFGVNNISNLPLSFGAGVFFTEDRGGGVTFLDVGLQYRYSTPYSASGGFVFMDVFFAQLSIGVWSGSGTWPLEERVYGVTFRNGDASLFGFDVSLFGKLPFTIIPAVVEVFPLLGLSYRAVLAAREIFEERMFWNGHYGGRPDARNLSALWFRFGGGMDISVGQRWFLRVTGTYGFRLLNRYERVITYVADASVQRGHGADLSIALGFRTFSTFNSLIRTGD